MILFVWVCSIVCVCSWYFFGLVVWVVSEGWVRNSEFLVLRVVILMVGGMLEVVLKDISRLCGCKLFRDVLKVV